MQIPPKKELAYFVKHYLWVESTSRSIQKLRLFSDGNTGLAFSFSKGSFQEEHQTPKSRKVILYGQIGNHIDFSVRGDLSLLIVVFKPFGISHLSGIPANELTNQLIPAEDLLGFDILDLYEQLGNTPTLGKFALLDDYLQMKSLRERQFIPKSIGHALDILLEQKGCVDVDQFSDQLNVSTRKLERQFSHFIGISPKPLMRIIRLHHLLYWMKHDQKKNLTSYSYRCGYYDQSHAIREFKKITGMSPGAYLKNTLPLAVNLVLV